MASIKNLDHEIGHKYQNELIKDKYFSETIGMGKDREAFEYDLKYYDAKNPMYYKNSILERDTRKNEKVTKTGFDIIGKKLIDLEESADKDTQGYLAIDKPKALSKEENPFSVSNEEAIKSRNNLEKLIKKEPNLKNILSLEENRKLLEIIKSYKEFKNFEETIGENLRKTFLKNLESQLNELKENNKELALIINSKEVQHSVVGTVLPQVPKISDLENDERTFKNLLDDEDYDSIDDESIISKEISLAEEENIEGKENLKAKGLKRNILDDLSLEGIQENMLSESSENIFENKKQKLQVKKD